MVLGACDDVSWLTGLGVLVGSSVVASGEEFVEDTVDTGSVNSVLISVTIVTAFVGITVVCKVCASNCSVENSEGLSVETCSTKDTEDVVSTSVVPGSVEKGSIVSEKGSVSNCVVTVLEGVDSVSSSVAEERSEIVEEAISSVFVSEKGIEDVGSEELVVVKGEVLVTSSKVGPVVESIKFN